MGGPKRGKNQPLLLVCLRSEAKQLATANPSVASDDLLLRLDFRDPDPEVIDISPEGGVVSTLQESKIECISGDKVHFTASLNVGLKLTI